jgi:hypothetical protein
MVEVEASLIRIHFESATPFKVQANFDIPFFECKIDAYALEKWFNLLDLFCVGSTHLQKDNLCAP